MAIGGASNNPYNNKLNSMGLFKNAGISPERANNTERTEEPRTSDADQTRGRASELAATLRPDGFSGVVNADKMLATAGASNVARSTSVNATSNTGDVSALGEPASVGAVSGPGFETLASNDNFDTAAGNSKLALFANFAQAGTLSGDFNVSRENASTRDNTLLLTAAANG